MCKNQSSGKQWTGSRSGKYIERANTFDLGTEQTNGKCIARVLDIASTEYDAWIV